MSFENNNYICKTNKSVCSVSATDLKNNVSKTVFRKLCFKKKTQFIGTINVCTLVSFKELRTEIFCEGSLAYI